MHSLALAWLTFSGALDDVGRALRQGFYMFWDTLWALVLGFALSGAVQAFVPREPMLRRLGDHRPRTVTGAAALGMASSSCSYAAAAMAKALFARGADFVTSMAFMVASTNLVLELGLALVALMGWRFLAAEVVGGAIMIALLVVVGSLSFRGRALAEARASASSSSGPAFADARHAEEHGAASPRPVQRLRSRSGWTGAAGYTLGDLKMLRKELLIGFAVAGGLAELVPQQAWTAVFAHGHGLWTSVENAVVGPFVAIISFVCSVGNVPLAAALWKGGASFGGVVSFIFADLISFPLLLIYRKQYGGKMALRMLAVLWAVMSMAGLATEYLFRAAGWVPRHHATALATSSIRWDYTSVLDILALALFAYLCWLHRTGKEEGDLSRYASDPICGMQVEKASAPAHFRSGRQHLYFCSEHCREKYERTLVPDLALRDSP